MIGRAALYEARFSLVAIGAGICLVAALATASKLAALLLVAALTGVGFSSVRSGRARAIVLLVALLLVVGSGVLLVATPLGERVQSFVEGANLVELPLEGRLVIWSAGTEMFRDYPLTGAGFGSFREVFPRYMPAGSRARWAQAHNDYLEVLDRMSVGQEEWEVVAALRSPRTVLEVCRESSLGDFRICQILWAFRLIGVATLAATAEVEDEDRSAEPAVVPAAMASPEPGVPLGVETEPDVPAVPEPMQVAGPSSDDETFPAEPVERVEDDEVVSVDGYEDQPAAVG